MEHDLAVDRVEDDELAGTMNAGPAYESSPIFPPRCDAGHG
jgi:hypothetical protein